jgi:sorting nexin-1/2
MKMSNNTNQTITTTTTTTTVVEDDDLDINLEHVSPGEEDFESYLRTKETISVPYYDNNNNNNNNNNNSDTERMHIEVGQPMRIGEGLKAHIVFDVSFWTTYRFYNNKGGQENRARENETIDNTNTNNDKMTSSGLVKRRFSQFTKLYAELVEEVDGVIVPSLPPKTTFPLDDPNSPAIASRATLLREFSAKISLHPLLSRSKALYDFLDCSKSNEKYNKLKLSATKDVKKKTTSVLSQIFGSVTNVISSINDSIAKATDVDFVGDGSNLFDVEGALREPISQIEICQYISSLKQRTEKMLASAKKVIKHKEKTTELFADLSTVFNTMQQHEQKGAEIINKISSISKNKTSSSSSASATSSKEGICWRKAAKTFSRIAQIDDTADVSEIKHERNKLFLEKISESLQMCVDVENALAVRKKIVDDYNQTLQSIARNSYRISSLGLPDAGPKREEKRRLELKVADLRVKKTALFQKYEHGRENMETELLWFHTELSKSLGSSLRLFVLTQGAEAGELHRSLLQI